MTGMKKHLLSAPALCMLAGISTAQADTYTVPAPLLAPSSVSAESARLPTPNGKEWDSFHGQLSSQKYSPLTQINKDNVGNLTKVWQYFTGDMSTGTGKIPPSVWSATPIFANDTLYVGTPFYRIIALEPETGKEKWVFDTKSPLVAETQPALKSRGVAYWQEKTPQAGVACQKVVYLGNMTAQLFAVDADTGKPCENFGKNGVVDINQWNTLNAKWPLSVLQPPTVIGDKLIVGWAGKDWEYEVESPGSLFALNARTGELEWEFKPIPLKKRPAKPVPPISGPPCPMTRRWACCTSLCPRRRPTTGAATAPSRFRWAHLPPRWISTPAKSSGRVSGFTMTCGITTSTRRRR
jgi:quinoprotein glucose dehydrogenase